MLSLVTAPTVEPVTVAEAKAHLRLFHADDDAYLEDFVIPAARRYAETLTTRALLSQTWSLKLSGFPGGTLVLPHPPLSSITSVQYVDSAGTTQTWSESSSGYQLQKPTGELALHGSIRPAYSQSYPSTRGIVDAVTITFVAGYGTTATTVPIGIKQGIFMLIEDLYAQRGSHGNGPMASSSRAMIAADMLLSNFCAYRDDLVYN